MSVVSGFRPAVLRSLPEWTLCNVVFTARPQLMAYLLSFPQDDHESGSSSTSRSVSDSAKAVAKPRRLQHAAPSDPDLPPGEWWSRGQKSSFTSLLRKWQQGQKLPLWGRTETWCETAISTIYITGTCFISLHCRKLQRQKYIYINYVSSLWWLVSGSLVCKNLFYIEKCWFWN